MARGAVGAAGAALDAPALGRPVRVPRRLRAGLGAGAAPGEAEGAPHVSTDVTLHEGVTLLDLGALVAQAGAAEAAAFSCDSGAGAAASFLVLGASAADVAATRALLRLAEELSAESAHGRAGGAPVEAPAAWDTEDAAVDDVPSLDAHAARRLHERRALLTASAVQDALTGALNRTISLRDRRVAVTGAAALFGCQPATPLLRFVRGASLSVVSAAAEGEDLVLLRLETTPASLMDLFASGSLSLSAMPRPAHATSSGGPAAARRAATTSAEDEALEAAAAAEKPAVGVDEVPSVRFGGPLAHIAYNLEGEAFHRTPDDLDTTGDLSSTARDPGAALKEVIVEGPRSNGQGAAKVRSRSTTVASTPREEVELLDLYLRQGIGFEFEASWSSGRFDRLRFVLTMEGTAGLQTVLQSRSQASEDDLRGVRTRVLVPRRGGDDDRGTNGGTPGLAAATSDEDPFDPLFARMQILPAVRIDAGPIPIWLTPRANTAAIARWEAALHGASTARGLDAAFRARIGLDYDRLRTERRIEPVWDLGAGPLRRREGALKVQNPDEATSAAPASAAMDVEVQMNVRVDAFGLLPMFASVAPRTWSRDVFPASAARADVPGAAACRGESGADADAEAVSTLDWAVRGRALVASPDEALWTGVVARIPGYHTMYSRGSSVPKLVEETKVKKTALLGMQDRIGAPGVCLLKRAYQAMCLPEDARDPCLAHNNASAAGATAASRCGVRVDMQPRTRLWGPSCHVPQTSSGNGNNAAPARRADAFTSVLGDGSSSSPLVVSGDFCPPYMSISHAAIVAVTGTSPGALSRPMVRLDVLDKGAPFAGLAGTDPARGLVPSPTLLGLTSFGDLVRNTTEASTTAADATPSPSATPGSTPTATPDPRSGDWVPKLPSTPFSIRLPFASASPSPSTSAAPSPGAAPGDRTALPLELADGVANGHLVLETTSQRVTVRATVRDQTSRLFGTVRDRFQAEFELPASCDLAGSLQDKPGAVQILRCVSVEADQAADAEAGAAQLGGLYGGVAMRVRVPLVPVAEPGKQAVAATGQEALVFEVRWVPRPVGLPFGCARTDRGATVRVALNQLARDVAGAASVPEASQGFVESLLGGVTTPAGDAASDPSARLLSAWVRLQNHHLQSRSSSRVYTQGGALVPRVGAFPDTVLAEAAAGRAVMRHVCLAAPAHAAAPNETALPAPGSAFVEWTCPADEDSSLGTCTPAVFVQPVTWAGDGEVARRPLALSPRLLARSLAGPEAVLDTVSLVAPAAMLSAPRSARVRSVLLESAARLEVVPTPSPTPAASASASASSQPTPTPSPTPTLLSAAARLQVLTPPRGDAPGACLDASADASTALAPVEATTLPTTVTDATVAQPAVPRPAAAGAGLAGAAGVSSAELADPSAASAVAERLLDALSPDTETLEVRFSDAQGAATLVRDDGAVFTDAAANALLLASHVGFRHETPLSEDLANVVSRGARAEALVRATPVERIVPGEPLDVFLRPGHTRLYEIDTSGGQVDEILVHLSLTPDACDTPPTTALFVPGLAADADGATGSPSETLRAAQWLLRDRGFADVVPHGWADARTVAALTAAGALSSLEGNASSLAGLRLEGTAEAAMPSAEELAHNESWVMPAAWDEALCPDSFDRLFRQRIAAAGLLDAGFRLDAGSVAFDWDMPLALSRAEHPSLFQGQRVLLRVGGLGDAWGVSARVTVDLVTHARPGLPAGVWGLQPGETRLVRAHIPGDVAGGQLRLGATAGDAGHAQASTYLSAALRLAPLWAARAAASSPGAGREQRARAASRGRTRSFVDLYPGVADRLDFDTVPTPQDDDAAAAASAQNSTEPATDDAVPTLLEQLVAVDASWAAGDGDAGLSGVFVPPPATGDRRGEDEVAVAEFGPEQVAVATGAGGQGTPLGLAVLVAVRVAADADADHVAAATFGVTVSAAGILPAGHCASAVVDGGGLAMYVLEAGRNGSLEGLDAAVTVTSHGLSRAEGFLVALPAGDEAEALALALAPPARAIPRGPRGATFHGFSSSSAEAKAGFSHEIRDSGAPRLSPLAQLASRFGMLPHPSWAQGASPLAAQAQVLATWTGSRVGGHLRVPAPTLWEGGAALLLVREPAGGTHTVQFDLVPAGTVPPARASLPQPSLSASSSLPPAAAVSVRALLQGGAAVRPWVRASELRAGGAVLEVRLVGAQWDEAVRTRSALQDMFAASIVRSGRAEDATAETAAGAWDAHARPVLRQAARRGTLQLTLVAPSVLRLTLPPLPALADALDAAARDAVSANPADVLPQGEEAAGMDVAAMADAWAARADDVLARLPAADRSRGVWAEWAMEPLDAQVPSPLLRGHGARGTGLAAVGALWLAVADDVVPAQTAEEGCIAALGPALSPAGAALALSRARGDLAMREATCAVHSVADAMGPADEWLGDGDDGESDGFSPYPGRPTLLCADVLRPERTRDRLAACAATDAALYPASAALGDLFRPPYFSFNEQRSVFGLFSVENDRDPARYVAVNASADPAAARPDACVAAAAMAGDDAANVSSLCSVPAAEDLGAFLARESACAMPELFSRLDGTGSGGGGGALTVGGPAARTPLLFAPAGHALQAAGRAVVRSGGSPLHVVQALRPFVHDWLVSTAVAVAASGQCDDDVEPQPLGLCAVAAAVAAGSPCWAATAPGPLVHSRADAVVGGVEGAASAFSEGRAVVLAPPPDEDTLAILADFGWVPVRDTQTPEELARTCVSADNSTVNGTAEADVAATLVFVGQARRAPSSAAPDGDAMGGDDAGNSTGNGTAWENTGNSTGNSSSSWGEGAWGNETAVTGDGGGEDESAWWLAAPAMAPEGAPTRYGVHRLAVLAFQRWWNRNPVLGTGVPAFGKSSGGVVADFGKSAPMVAPSAAAEAALAAELGDSIPHTLDNPGVDETINRTAVLRRLSETGVVDVATRLRLLATPLVPGPTATGFCSCPTEAALAAGFAPTPAVAGETDPLAGTCLVGPGSYDSPLPPAAETEEEKAHESETLSLRERLAEALGLSQDDDVFGFGFRRGRVPTRGEMPAVEWEAPDAVVCGALLDDFGRCAAALEWTGLDAAFPAARQTPSEASLLRIGTDALSDLDDVTHVILDGFAWPDTFRSTLSYGRFKPMLVVLTTRACAQCAQAEVAADALAERTGTELRVAVVSCAPDAPDSSLPPLCSRAFAASGSSQLPQAVVTFVEDQRPHSVAVGAEGVDWNPAALLSYALSAVKGEADRLSIPAAEGVWTVVEGGATVVVEALRQATEAADAAARATRACEAQQWWAPGTFAPGLVPGTGAQLLAEHLACRPQSPGACAAKGAARMGWDAASNL